MNSKLQRQGAFGEPGPLHRRMPAPRSTAGSRQTLSTEHISLHKLLWVTPLTFVVAVLANEILYGTASALMPSIGQWPVAGPLQVLLGTLLYVILGSLVFALVFRFVPRPIRTYWIIATIALILSFTVPVSLGAGLGPSGVPIPDTSTVFTLVSIHIVTYLIIMSMVTQLTRIMPDTTNETEKPIKMESHV